MSEDRKQERAELSRKLREHYDDLGKDVEKLKKVNPSLSILFAKVLLIIASMQAEKFSLMYIMLDNLHKLSSTTLSLINEIRQSIPDISEEQINRLEEMLKAISRSIEETRKEAERTPHFII